MKASCACGALTAQASRAPLRVGLCHCNACRTRTGSAFSLNARFAHADVQTDGTAKAYARQGDDGGTITYHFCPVCGVSVWYENDQVDGIMIPAGAMAPGALPAPDASIYDTRRPDWLQVRTGAVLG